MRISPYLAACIPASLILLLSYCRFSEQKPEQATTEGYWGHVDTIGYVGMSTCASCHPSHHQSYLRTGMGRSFGLASRERSDADYSAHPRVYDEQLNLYYQPFWRRDTLFIAEFRLDGKDTVHYLEERIRYVIGSGQHTNSHLIERDGYLYQAPITFYTQDGRWDMAPGFEGGHNSRFARMIQSECMTCHNGLPDPVTTSLNAFHTVPNGIDCERCHGPGAEHVRQKLAGLSVDTANHIDYSIINPARLSLELQIDLCQRCHLQGVSVLNEGSDWYDFLPGHRIREHWNVFLPDFEGQEGEFLMASQAERLRRSACFISSGEISCMTCHNPHVSVKETAREVFNKPCRSCHEQGDDCSAGMALRLQNQDDCSNCHMPRSGSVDIPHVTITDHKVSIPGRSVPAQAEFRGLECLTDENPSAITMGKAYLSFYEAFSNRSAMLDSARHYLNRAKSEQLAEGEWLRNMLHLHYLADEYDQASALLEGLEPQQWNDAWSCYRAGECLMIRGDQARALDWLSRSVELLPAHPEFRLKQANALALLGRMPEALSAYETVLSQDRRSVSAWSNLGFLKLQQSDLVQGERFLLEAARLDPDYLPARLHLAQLYKIQNRQAPADSLMRHLLKHHSAAEEVQQLAQRWKNP